MMDKYITGAAVSFQSCCIESFLRDSTAVTILTFGYSLDNQRRIQVTDL